jgi:Domain of unknown function (DUF4349)
MRSDRAVAGHGRLNRMAGHVRTNDELPRCADANVARFVMGHLWKKAAAIAFLAFVALWVAALVRGLAMPAPPAPYLRELSLSDDRSSRLLVSNNLRVIGLEQTPLPLMLEQPAAEQIQVFEKTARLVAGSAAFDDDEALIRAALTAYQATVFNEKSAGIAPDRQLALEIGVHPDKFAALVAKLRTIGRLESVSVQQRDRTGEFRGLNAQRQSLKQYLAAIQRLRGGNNPSVEDSLKVEQKIQEVEKELQTLGVQLGDLLGKESFYHIQVSLRETPPGGRFDQATSIPVQIFLAFVRAMTWWLAVVAAIGVLGATFASIRALWPDRSVRRVE